MSSVIKKYLVKEGGKMLILEKAIKNYVDTHSATLAQFADSIGVTYRTLNYFMRGIKTPSVCVLKRISTITGVSMDELSKDVK